MLGLSVPSVATQVSSISSVPVQVPLVPVSVLSESMSVKMRYDFDNISSVLVLPVYSVLMPVPSVVPAVPMPVLPVSVQVPSVPVSVLSESISENKVGISQYQKYQ